MSRANNGPQFVRWFNPVLIALKELGGSGSAAEVVAAVAKNERVPEDVQLEKLKSGGLRFHKQVHFARQYLVWAGLLGDSPRGVWTLTDQGRSTSLSADDALNIYQQQQQLLRNSKNSENAACAEPEEEIVEAPETDYRAAILKKLMSLSPAGFEHFSQRLLREFGFEKLEVTGGPKDKGIDGTGILKINPFVSFRVAFQCKRYADAVTSSAIATFQGSIPSNVDIGILITTSYFTSDAKSLAQDAGLKPIELIDGDQLIQLMEEMHLGLKPTYVVDHDFFDSV